MIGMRFRSLPFIFANDNYTLSFKADVSTKTIEDICQLLQCQPEDIIEWKIQLNPELSFEAIKQKIDAKSN